jgi:predicted metal-dependent enzyme (double-stranded beta helix superfamily)
MNIRMRATSMRTNIATNIRMYTATGTHMVVPMTMLFMKMNTSIREKNVHTTMSMPSMKLRTTIINTGKIVTEVNEMPAPPKPLPEIQSICHRWSENIENINSKRETIVFFQNELPGLLLNRQLFVDLLDQITRGGTYPELRQAMMFENEYLLYLNSHRRFSLRMFIFEPGEYTPIHDHNSWGVSGNVSGDLEVVKYARKDDGKRAELARLWKSDRYRLVPGDTELTLPLDEGIHQTGNPTAETIIMISVYGPSIRRLYINCFDMANNRVQRIYPQRLKKKIRASRALLALEPEPADKT